MSSYILKSQLKGMKKKKFKLESKYELAKMFKMNDLKNFEKSTKRYVKKKKKKILKWK